MARYDTVGSGRQLRFLVAFFGFATAIYALLVVSSAIRDAPYWQFAVFFIPALYVVITPGGIVSMLVLERLMRAGRLRALVPSALVGAGIAGATTAVTLVSIAGVAYLSHGPGGQATDPPLASGVGGQIFAVSLLVGLLGAMAGAAMTTVRGDPR